MTGFSSGFSGFKIDESLKSMDMPTLAEKFREKFDRNFRSGRRPNGKDILSLCFHLLAMRGRMAEADEAIDHQRLKKLEAELGEDSSAEAAWFAGAALKLCGAGVSPFHPMLGIAEPEVSAEGLAYAAGIQSADIVAMRRRHTYALFDIEGFANFGMMKAIISSMAARDLYDPMTTLFILKEVSEEEYMISYVNAAMLGIPAIIALADNEDGADNRNRTIEANRGGASTLEMIRKGKCSEVSASPFFLTKFMPVHYKLLQKDRIIAKRR